MAYTIFRDDKKVMTVSGLGWAYKKLNLSPALPDRKPGAFYIPYFEKNGYVVRGSVGKSSAPQFDEAKLQQMIDKAIKSQTSNEPVVLSFKINDRPAVTLKGHNHKKQADLIRLVNIKNAFGKRLNPYLHGPAGSGKTEGAAKTAEATGLKFYAQSFHPFSEPGDIFGYVDAMGEVVSTPFREAYTKGGVYLADELDAASGRILTAFNMALAQSQLMFPAGKDGESVMTPKHENFIFIGAGNTVLTGGNRTYSGRQELDGATIQRFTFLEWNYDLAFEKNSCSDERWLNICWKVRENIEKHSLTKFVISVRNMVDGEALIANGFSYADAFEMRIAQGCAKEMKALLMDGITL